MDVTGSGLLETAAEYEAFRLGKEVDGELYRDADPQWFRAILSGVVENQKAVDPVIGQSLTEDWPLSRLDSTLRDASIFLGLDTLIGPLYLAAGVDNGGETAFYLFLGRPF